MFKMISITLYISLMTGFSCTERTPHDPHWNKDSCTHCRMILSERRYAVQLIGPDNRTRYYDDLICALKDQQQHPDIKAGVLYVRPYGQEAWVSAKTATYDSNFQTPMNSGMGAVSKGGKYQFKDVVTILEHLKHGQMTHEGE